MGVTESSKPGQRVPSRRSRAFLIALALPCYVGAAFVGLIVVFHMWPSTPAVEPPLWLGLVQLAVLYVGIFCWGFGPIPGALAVVLLLWELWRTRTVTQLGCLVPLFVLGSAVVWMASLPFFVEALKW